MAGFRELAAVTVEHNPRTLFGVEVMQHEALRLIRQFHDLTLTETAQRLGISKSYLSGIENGAKSPTLEILEGYARVFNLPVSHLMLFSESINTPEPTRRSRQVITGKVIRMLQWLEHLTENDENEMKKVEAS